MRLPTAAAPVCDFVLVQVHQERKLLRQLIYKAMPRIKKVKMQESPVMNSTVTEEIKIHFQHLHPLSLNLDLGRQDLNENFHKIQEAINQLISHGK